MYNATNRIFVLRPSVVVSDTLRKTYREKRKGKEHRIRQVTRAKIAPEYGRMFLLRLREIFDDGQKTNDARVRDKSESHRRRVERSNCDGTAAPMVPNRPKILLARSNHLRLRDRRGAFRILHFSLNVSCSPRTVIRFSISTA